VTSVGSGGGGLATSVGQETLTTPPPIFSLPSHWEVVTLSHTVEGKTRKRGEEYLRDPVGCDFDRGRGVATSVGKKP